MKPYHLFEAVGIELEYMIVDKHTLDVKPITDKVLYAIAGQYLTEVCCGAISYSNELALHIIELKTTDPMPNLEGVQALFHDHINSINRLLEPYQAKLLSSACHPWMDPIAQMQLWPHEQSPIYEAYHRLFDCRGHGWANLQSTHINLPFSGDDEFARLHSACRLILPLLPAIAASSPILNGQITGKLDTRLDVYQYNQKRFPLITGDVIPEPVFSKKEYELSILNPMYDAIKPYDTDGALQHEWLNSRGAIARFCRDTIEIRVLDIQECPRADIEIAQAVIYVLEQLVHEQMWSPVKTWSRFPNNQLADLFHACVANGDEAVIDNLSYLKIFGIDRPLRANELWRYLLTDFLAGKEKEPLELILRKGPLARRMIRFYKKNESKHGLQDLCHKLSYCLAHGELFDD